MLEPADKLRQILAEFEQDPNVAHRVVFGAQDNHQDAVFHPEMVSLIHSDKDRVCIIGFRGSAKSTKIERAIAIMTGERKFRYCIVFGCNEDRANERVHAIRRILERNKKFKNIFGDLRGQPWADGHLETSTGIIIKAMGRGQAIRGTKGEELRPDLVVFDDIEDKESVRTPEGRKKTQEWVFGDVLPMMDVGGRAIMACNDLDPECLGNILARPGTGWVVKRYPWVYQDITTGARRAAWPSRFPLEYVDKLRASMAATGHLSDYNKEYMCRSEAPEDKSFKAEMIRIDPVIRTWHAVYCFFDPARTVKSSSATTGFAAWSYIGNKIIVWDAWGRRLMPDEIVSAMFQANEDFHPMIIGVEEDGLNEFLLQPIRHEQLRRRAMIPYKAYRAPKGKLDFIRGLQPFFNAREIVFARELPDLRAQLLGFPTGAIDVPNALAYLLKMRLGPPMIDGFSGKNVSQDLPVFSSKPAWVVLNASPSLLTAALVQFVDGQIRVAADWVLEGDPSALVGDVIQEAAIAARRQVRVMAPPQHFERFTNVGLKASTVKAGLTLERGVACEMGRLELRDRVNREVRAQPAFVVSADAHWTCNAFAGGYAKAVEHATGQLKDWAVEGPYRLLAESIESFAGLLKVASPDRDDASIHYDQTPDGRRFISARR